MNMETTKAAQTVILTAEFRLSHADQVREGYVARSTGDACPYPQDTDDRTAWEYGWAWADRRRGA